MSIEIDVSRHEDGRPSSCEHEVLEPRIRTLSNGTQAPYWQCLTCGAGVRAVRRDEHRARSEAACVNQPFDNELRDAWDAQQRRAWDDWQSRRAENAAYQSQAWWANYNAYLATDAWRRKSRMRLEHDRYECQARLPGCTQRASQVHHLSYKHLRNEPLFELVSVCAACHDAIHAQERGEARDHVVLPRAEEPRPYDIDINGWVDAEMRRREAGAQE